MRGGRDYVSASELARLSYCERQIAFDAQVGERSTPAQRAARNRGEAAHERFYQESLRIQRLGAHKTWCFISTLALGECPETRTLRAFRDLYLRDSAAGRWLVRRYYAFAPNVCRLLMRHPSAIPAVGRLLRLVAAAARSLVARRLRQ